MSRDHLPESVKPVRAVIIRPSNEVTDAVMRGLTDYKEALDGAWLEPIPLANGVMYIDEEFLLKNPGPSDVNRIATRVVQSVGLIELDTWIFGPAVVVGLPDREGYETDIPEKLLGFIHLIETGLSSKDD